MLYVGFDGFLSLFVKCVYGLPSVLLMATSVIWEIVVFFESFNLFFFSFDMFLCFPGSVSCEWCLGSILFLVCSVFFGFIYCESID